MPLRGSRRLFWLMAACLAGLATTVAAEDVEVSFDGARLEFSLDVVVHATAADVMVVVHDYDRLDRVLPLVVESRPVGAVGDGVERVFTLMRGCLLFVCREVVHTVDLRRVPSGWSSGITVPDLSQVRQGEFSWRIDEAEGDASHSRIRMDGFLEPDFRIPALLGSTLVQWWVRGELRQSIGQMQRAAQAHGASSPALQAP